MRKRNLIVVLAAIAMTMTVMAPASAHGGLTKDRLEDRGWSCFDNSGDGGAGNHCSRVEIGEYIDGGTGGLFLFVFNGGDGDKLLGYELLRFTSRDLTQRRCNREGNWGNLFGDLYACHRWIGGSAPS